jgi:parallel beta-helix repeat protein
LSIELKNKIVLWIESNKIFLLALVLIIILVAVLAVFLIPREAKPGTIYIRATGEVEGTDKIQRDRNVYTFIDNIFNKSIVIERDNIVVDGAGYTLQGTGAEDSKGIDLSHRNKVTIKNVEVTNTEYGIFLNYSSKNILAGNTASNNEFGICLLSSNNNALTGNTAYLNTYCGIYLALSSNNIIKGNNASNHGEIYRDGIILDFKCNNNVLTGNTVSGNYVGINHHISSNNTLFHNNFINNAKQMGSINSTNIWDNGVEGNYWSNYTGVDSDNDGIGDTPHILPGILGGNNIDYYPLMGIFSGFNTTLGKYAYVISNSTIEDFTFFESNSTIRMYVSNMTGTQTFGFCRVCIPHALMNVSGISVIIDNGLTPVLHQNYNLYDNGTHRWIYFAYEHSRHKINIIPEFPTLKSMQLPLILLTVAKAIYKRRLSKTPNH